MPTTYSFTAVTSPENQQPSVWEPGFEPEPAEPVEVSRWDLRTDPIGYEDNPIFSTTNSPTWAASNDDKTLNVSSGASNQRVETVSRPLRNSGRRYFELSWDGFAQLDQFGFASGPIAEAGGTIDFLDFATTPFSAILFLIGYNTSTGLYFWWIRLWESDGTFTDDSFNVRSFPSLAEGDRIGWDVDLDTGTVVGVYHNGVNILPDTLSGADLTAWNNLNTWLGGSNGGAQFFHRASRGEFQTTLHMLPEDLLYPIPTGAVAWDS